MALRLLAVHAHPDDESSKGAATYAHYVEQGAQVLVATCTGGERGDILHGQVADDPHAQRDLAGLRRLEMANAQQIIGCQHRWLGFEDSGLPAAHEAVSPLSFAGLPLETAALPLLRLVRAFRPHVLITYNEHGGYPHPDHIRAHQIGQFVWEHAGNPDKYPQLGSSWQIQKLYYDEIYHRDRFAALLTAAKEADPQSQISADLQAIVDRFAKRSSNYTTQLPVAQYFARRDRALLAHRSQVSPEHTFFFVPNELQALAWPWEDYRLVASRLPQQAAAAPTPETDLFAGIIEE